MGLRIPLGLVSGDYVSIQHTPPLDRNVLTRCLLGGARGEEFFRRVEEAAWNTTEEELRGAVARGPPPDPAGPAQRGGADCSKEGFPY